MGLVEPVAGELGHLVEDVRGPAFGDPTGDRAFDKSLALFVHLRLDLFAHGLAQQVGAAQGIPGQFLGDLQHLFLVDHDAEGFLEDAFQGRIQVVDFLVAVLAPDVAGNVIHGTGAEERDHGDQLFEGIQVQLAEHILHARAFQLEHARGVGPAQHFKGRRIVQREAEEVQLDPPPL